MSLASHDGSNVGIDLSDPNFNPNCDIDNDGGVFLFDAVILLSHYGQKYP